MSHLGREFVVALLARGLQVQLVEFGLLVELLVAHRTGKVMHAPGLVQSGEYISPNDLVAHEAQVPEQLMIVGLAVRQALLLVMPMSQEWLLTAGTHKVLHMPMFTQGGHHTLLYRPAAGTADRDAHLVVTAEAVQLVHIISCIARTTLDFSSIRIEFSTTRGTIEMIRVVNFTPKLERLIVNHTMALVAHMLAEPNSFSLGITLMA